MYLLSIDVSPNPKKKYVAVFRLHNGRTKTVHFGAKGMSDYTIHKSEKRKQAYLARHSFNEDWNEPTSAGALSRWILWNKTTLSASITDFKRRFNL
jgi:hypothetical protein